MGTHLMKNTTLYGPILLLLPCPALACGQAMGPGKEPFGAFIVQVVALFLIIELPRAIGKTLSKIRILSLRSGLWNRIASAFFIGKLLFFTLLFGGSAFVIGEVSSYILNGSFSPARDVSTLLLVISWIGFRKLYRALNSPQHVVATPC
jgi:hypothetical protein